MYSYPNPKTNIAATNPTVSDDLTVGYAVGSEWLNTATEHLWKCFDNSPGAASWVDMTGPAGPAGPTGPTGPTGPAGAGSAADFNYVGSSESLVADDSKVYVRELAAAATLTLPDPTAHHQMIFVRSSAAGYVQQYASEQIDGVAATFSMGTGGGAPNYAGFISDGTDWHVFLKA